MLVTGASGYVGSRVAAALASGGVELHLAGRHGPAITRARGAAFHEVDLLAAGASRRLVEAVRPSLLVHLAWDVTPGQYWTSPDNARWRDATAALAEAFFDAGGTRFVGAGTCAEYDWTSGVCDERTTAIAPASPYGAAKAAAWDAVLKVSSRQRQDGALTRSAAWARIFFPFGGDDEHPSRLVPSVLHAIRRGEPALCSPGDQRRDFLHVDEIASAIAALALSAVAGPVNIGSGEAHAVRDVVLGLASRLGRPDLVKLGARPADPVPLVTARVDRLTSEVGWRPRWTFDQALDRTINPSATATS